MANNLISEEVIMEKVRSIIAEALGVEEEMITAEVGLIDELGAESLDFLDIAFRLEREFDLQFPRDNLGERIQSQHQDQYDEELFFRDGVSTDAFLVILKEMMPEVDESKMKKGMTQEEIAYLFTPNTWVRTIQTLLDAISEKCENCDGKTVAKVEEFIQYVCDKCGEKIPVPDGDDVFLKLMEDGMKQPHILEAIEKEKKVLAEIKAKRAAEEELQRETLSEKTFHNEASSTETQPKAL